MGMIQDIPKLGCCVCCMKVRLWPLVLLAYLAMAYRDVEYVITKAMVFRLLDSIIVSRPCPKWQGNCAVFICRISRQMGLVAFTRETARELRNQFHSLSEST